MRLLAACPDFSTLETFGEVTAAGETGSKGGSLEAVLAAAIADHGALTAKALMLIEDPDSVVRRLTVRLLARASDEQLSGAIPYVIDHHVVDLIYWLLSEGNVTCMEMLYDRDRGGEELAAGLQRRDP